MFIHKGLKSLQADMKILSDVLKWKNPRDVPHLNSIHKATEQEFLSEMNRLPLSTREILFPDNIIVVFWKPLKLQRSNYKIICDLGQVFWTKQQDSSHKAGCSICSMLSCIRAIPCNAGLRVDHNIYGQGQDLLQSHVYAALEYLKESQPGYSGCVEYLLCYPLDMKVRNTDLFDEFINWNPGRCSMHEKRVAIGFSGLSKI